MAAKVNTKLTNPQRVRLGQSISKPHMKSIAEGYFDLDEEKVTNLERKHQDDMEAFNGDFFKMWEYMNYSCNQVKNLASLLYKAAEEGGYIDPMKIEKILGFTKEGAQTIKDNTINMFYNISNKEPKYLTKSILVIWSRRGSEDDFAREVKNNDAGTCTDEDITKQIAGTSTEPSENLCERIVAEYEDGKSKGIVQQIRQHTLGTTKPEMAPWVKDYTPKMEDIQTRLRIIHPDYIQNGDINDYKELFVNCW